MKVKRVGTVTFTETTIKVEDWILIPEASDPQDATPEELLLEVAIPWAQKKLRDAMTEALQEVSRKRKAALSNPTTVTGSN